MPARGFISSAQIAGIMGVSRWSTRLTIHAYHAKGVDIDISGDVRVAWGIRLQPAILAAVAEQEHIEVRPNTGDKFVRHVDPNVRAGCTVDGWARQPESGEIVVEVKNVDFFEYKEHWTEATAPIDIELQVQFQLWVTGAPSAIIAALVGGNDLKVYRRQRNERVIAKIAETVEQFWRDFDAGVVPDPTGIAAEIPVLAELYPIPVPKKTLDKMNDHGFIDLLNMLEHAGEQRAFWQRTEEAHKVKVLAAAVDCDSIRANGWYGKIKKFRHASGTIVQKLTMKKIENDLPITAPDVTPIGA